MIPRLILFCLSLLALASSVGVFFWAVLGLAIIPELVAAILLISMLVPPKLLMEC